MEECDMKLSAWLFPRDGSKPECGSTAADPARQHHVFEQDMHDEVIWQSHEHGIVQDRPAASRLPKEAWPDFS